MFEEVYKKTKPESLLPCLLIFNQVPNPESEEMKNQLNKWYNQFQANHGIKKNIIIPLYMETALKTALGKVILEDDPFYRSIEDISIEIKQILKN